MGQSNTRGFGVCAYHETLCRRDAEPLVNELLLSECANKVLGSERTEDCVCMTIAASEGEIPDFAYALPTAACRRYAALFPDEEVVCRDHEWNEAQ